MISATKRFAIKQSMQITDTRIYRISSKNIFTILTLITLIIFTGCASLATPKPNIDTTNEPKWWQEFNDKNLNNFEEIALNDNSSLLAKLYAYEKAKLNVDLQTNAMLPNFSASLNADAFRAIDKSDTLTRSFGSNLKISYEADLFGKLKNAKNAKELEASATLQDYLSARLVLASEVAKQYFKIAYINENITLTKQDIELQTKIFNATKVRFKAGDVSKLDFLTSEQSLLTLSATLDNLEFEKKTAISSLALLLDMQPNSVLKNLPNSMQYAKLPRIGEMPVNALSRRPDIMANELRLKAAFSSIDAAKLSFYPSFTLISSIGTSSNKLLEILHDPVGAIGLNILLPFINYNENALHYKISKAAYEEAKANFRSSLFAAMKEISDALNMYEAYTIRNKKLIQNMSNSKEIQKLSYIRYKAGAISMVDLLQVMQAAINSQQSFLDNKYQMFIARIDLFVATGGH